MLGCSWKKVIFQTAWVIQYLPHSCKISYQKRDLGLPCLFTFPIGRSTRMLDHLWSILLALVYTDIVKIQVRVAGFGNWQISSLALVTLTLLGYANSSTLTPSLERRSLRYPTRREFPCSGWRSWGSVVQALYSPGSQGLIELVIGNLPRL